MKDLSFCDWLITPFFPYMPFHTVHGVLKARILKWFAIPFSSGLHLSEICTMTHPSWLIEPWGMAAAAPKSLQLCPTLCDPIDGSPPGSPVPAWDSPGKNTGVGCHLLLQCMKVKSESEVSQLCLILSNPMDCSLPGSSIHGIFQARVLEWGAIAFSVGHGRPP